MYLFSHEVKNFRNLKDTLFMPEKDVNVVYGANGQGKTNLLESIYLLTGAKSFRARKDSELIRIKEEFSVSESSFFLAGRDQQIKLFISAKGREAELNRGTRKKAAALAGTFCAVLFSPEHLMLIKGSPEHRRKFMDLALCQILPGYLPEFRRYTRLVSQKNGLLKDAHRIPDAYDMLDVYDSQLVDSALTVSGMRMRFVDELRVFAKKDYAAVSGNSEELHFEYQSTLFLDGAPDFSSGMQKIRELRDTDLRAGFCTAGPHRDDLYVTLGDESARIYASQGQQRSAVLALKLAEAGVMGGMLGEKPVLLLDDVLSELDSRRQDYLIERLAGYQTVITGCDPNLISRRISAALFEMEGGRLKQNGQGI